MKHITIFITIFFLFSCNRIENKAWKYRDGFHIGDWIEFDDTVFLVKNDTIFNRKIPIAKIHDYQNRFVDQILVIEQLNDTIKGFYCSKGRK